jgi:hypothetical protein
MNIVLPMWYKNLEYLIEYNEPDSTPDPKDYTVRIVSINDKGTHEIEVEEQIGKEFTFRTSDLSGHTYPVSNDDEHHILELIIKTYRDHIAKDVNGIHRV